MICFLQSDYRRLISSVSNPVQAAIVWVGMPLAFICLAMFSFSSCIPFSIPFPLRYLFAHTQNP